MPTLVIIGGGEQDYHEGREGYAGQDDTRANMTDRLRRSLGETRDDLRAQKNLRRYERGRRMPRRT